MYYSLVVNNKKKMAVLNIFGDITSMPYFEGDVSYVRLSQELARMENIEQIDVHISSYGGEVMEGLAIYNALRRHKAHVTTYCDGSACSIASVIFMAGDERIMSKPSFLMIHDAWTVAQGNADELRKQADDLETITTASVTAYMEHVNIAESKLRKLMKAESWLTHDEALEMGFATAIEESSDADKPSQNVKNRVFEMLASFIAKQADIEDENDTENEDDVEALEKPSDALDSDDEEERDDEEESGENDAERAEDASDSDDDENNDEKPDENDAAQRWSGFFNALFRA